MSVMLYPCIFCVALLMDLFCVVCCVFNSVCESFGETIRNMFGCGCYFVVERYGGVESVWRCSVGYTVYGFPKNVCVGCVCACRKLSPHLGV